MPSESRADTPPRPPVAGPGENPGAGQPDLVFGAWGERAEDGLGYQRRLREEWPDRVGSRDLVWRPAPAELAALHEAKSAASRDRAKVSNSE